MSLTSGDPMQQPQVPTGPLPPVAWDPDDHVWTVVSGGGPALPITVEDGTVVISPPANATEIRNGTNAQCLEIYESFVSDSDYTKLEICAQPGGPFTIVTDAQPVGPPTNRDLVILATDDIQILAPNNHILIQAAAGVGIEATTDTAYVQLNAAGDDAVASIQFNVGTTAPARWVLDTVALFPITTNRWDLGKSAQRLRVGYLNIVDTPTLQNLTRLAFIGGSALYSGGGAPAAGLGGNGDYFFRFDTPGTANQRLYIKSAGAWVGIL